MRRYFLLFTLFISAFLHAQDTLTVMQYNLLYYGVNTDFCTPSNNSLSVKDGHLRTVLEYARPDIFTVNEISSSQAIQQHLLDQVLNTNGIYYYRRADFKAIAESDIVNQLYYNSNKLILKDHVIAQSVVRDIDVYRLYYRADDLDQGDTAFIICVVAHLKAGTDASDENSRKVMAQLTMDFLVEYDAEANYLLMGDLNLYAAGEPAYQEFLNPDEPDPRFLDPVDAYGNWHSNYAFRYRHTQSTVLNSNGCQAGGGCDDRFDFILASTPVMDGSRAVQFIEGSYRTLGQDGNHFNNSIDAPPVNTSVPGQVLTALAENSDHLPVSLDLKVDKVLGVDDHPFSTMRLSFQNPAQGILSLQIDLKKASKLTFEILDLTGRVQIKQNHQLGKGHGRLIIPLGNLPKGNYLLRISDEGKMAMVKKLLVF